MMCVSGEREGEGERGYDVWIRHSGIYIQFPIRCIIHVHVLTTHTTPCTQITA